MEITLSIIGTAGRKDDADKLSKQHFDAMYVIASGLLNQLAEYNYKITHLVSGGAAWADHVAVKLFLNKKVPNLRLFIPAKWDNGIYKSSTGQSNKNGNSYSDDGGICNYYHRKFQITTGINSLSEIQVAKCRGAKLIEVERGFYARNSLIAKSDFILAMTFGKEHEVKEGGTADTIRKYLNIVHKQGFFDKSFHYDLNTGKIFVGCTVPSEPIKKDIKSTKP